MEEDKELANDLNYNKIKFPITEEDFIKIETKTTFGSMCFAIKIN